VAALGAVIAVAVIVALWYLLAGPLPSPSPPPPAEPPKTESQPADCPDVQVISIPGTWESAEGDDPYAPNANPASLMLNVSRPLQEQFEAARADVYTVPYVAQFSNPIAIPPDGQLSYNLSRGAGTDAAVAFMAQRAQHCPLTSFVLTGFSQGAVIAGNIASDIGRGVGPVPADRVLGVGLIADGRRDPAQGTGVGPAVEGVGAEVALAGIKIPGITMTGSREGGFGALDERVFTICAPDDGICDAPAEAFTDVVKSASRLMAYAGNPVHSLYNTYVVDENGVTATQWMVQWAAALIVDAPYPAHS
jgi:hypothetical protein